MDSVTSDSELYTLYRFFPAAVYSVQLPPAVQREKLDAGLTLGKVFRRILCYKAHNANIRLHRKTITAVNRVSLFWKGVVHRRMRTSDILQRFSASGLTVEAIGKKKPSQVHPYLLNPAIAAPLKQLMQRLMGLCRDLEKADTLRVSPYLHSTDLEYPSIFSVPSAALCPDIFQMAYVTVAWPVMMYKYIHGESVILHGRARRLIMAIEEMLQCDGDHPATVGPGSKHFIDRLRVVSEAVVLFYASYKEWRKEHGRYITMHFHRIMASYRYNEQKLTAPQAVDEFMSRDEHSKELDTVRSKLKSTMVNIARAGGVAEVRLSNALGTSKAGLRMSPCPAEALMHALLLTPNLQLKAGDGHPLTLSGTFQLNCFLLKQSLHKQFETTWGEASSVMLKTMQQMSIVLMRHTTEAQAAEMHHMYSFYIERFYQGFFTNVFDFLRSILSVCTRMFQLGPKASAGVEEWMQKMKFLKLPHAPTPNDMITLALQGTTFTADLLTYGTLWTINHNLSLLQAPAQSMGVAYERLHLQRRLNDTTTDTETVRQWLVLASTSTQEYLLTTSGFHPPMALPPPPSLGTGLLYMLVNHLVTPKAAPLPCTFLWDQTAMLHCRAVVERFAHAITFIHSLQSARRYIGFTNTNLEVNTTLIQQGCDVQLRLPAGSDIFRAGIMSDIHENGNNSKKARATIRDYILSDLGVIHTNVRLDYFDKVQHHLNKVSDCFCLASAPTA